MEAEKANFPVKTMARLLGVSRSGFYEWLRRGEPEDPWLQARADVEREWAESDRRFGARLVRSRLPHLTLYRVRKIMRGLGTRGVTPNARKRTTIPDAGAPERPDLLKRDFTSPVPTYKLVGDITYLKTGQGWLFLSTVIDLNTRMVVGWSLSGRMTADIVVGSLEMAWRRGFVAGNAIFHSDIRGPQYRSLLLGKTMRERGIRPSMGSVASPWDNAPTESFMGILKRECVHRKTFETREQAQIEIFEYIETFYNRLRTHSALGFMSPVEFEEKMAEEKAVESAVIAA